MPREPGTRLPFRERCRAKRVSRLVNDIDDMLFETDPYGYMDGSDIIGGSFEEMHDATRRGIRTQISQKDPDLLEGLRSIRSNLQDEPRYRKIVRKIDGLIGRTERLYGRNKKE